MTADKVLEAYWKGYEDCLRLLQRGLGQGLGVDEVIGCLEGAMQQTRGEANVKE